MNTTGGRLDAEELLHLALNAADKGRHEVAIDSLKRGLDLSPGDARMHYLLGAEHAQIGLYDRAVEEIERAVELDPELGMARFQLGLLHLTSGRVAEAERAWAALERRDAGDALRLFKTGLLHLARDEFAECSHQLQLGIAANVDNPTLNNDMRKILSSIEQQSTATVLSDSAKRVDDSPPPPDRPVRVLKAYRNRSEEKE